MSVKFVRYSLPNGRKDMVEIDLEPDIEKMGNDLLNEGVIFDIEILRTGLVSMTAWLDDEENVLAHELCLNGPPVVESVIKLIKEARATWED